MKKQVASSASSLKSQTFYPPSKSLDAESVYPESPSDLLFRSGLIVMFCFQVPHGDYPLLRWRGREALNNLVAQGAGFGLDCGFVERQ